MLFFDIFSNVNFGREKLPKSLEKSSTPSFSDAIFPVAATFSGSMRINFDAEGSFLLLEAVY